MIIDIKNLGIISHVSVDTSRPLIIMCGPNSTGKTYLSYIIYSILSNNLRIVVSCTEQIKVKIKEQNEFILNKKFLDEFLNLESEAIKQSVNSIFGLPAESRQDEFRYFKIKLSISDKDYSDIIRNRLLAFLNFQDYRIEIKKEENSNKIKVQIIRKTESEDLIEIPWDFVIYHILRICSHYPIAGSRMLTVERNSIYTFNTELSLSRNELIDRLLDFEENGNSDEPGIINIINKGSQRYPITIRDSLRIANDLENIQKRKSPYFSFATQIESELLHGTIGISKMGSVNFQPQTTAKNPKKLPVHMSSSIVKTLSSLIIYLKHLAHKNDLLIIDEPEMNLHPDNQRILAGLFSKMVNNGLRLVISTHSDYIIREFNNLVMAHELSRQKRNGPELKNLYDKSELLDKKDLEVLYFKFGAKGKVSAKEAPINEFGFSAPTIDASIDRQNEIAERLFDALKYGE